MMIFQLLKAEESHVWLFTRDPPRRQQPRRLPPLTSDYVHADNSEHFNTRVAVGRNGESRAASAQPEESRRNFRTFYTTDGRPNTTSTFRVSTSFLIKFNIRKGSKRRFQSYSLPGMVLTVISTGADGRHAASPLHQLYPQVPQCGTHRTGDLRSQHRHHRQQ